MLCGDNKINGFASTLIALQFCFGMLIFPNINKSKGTIKLGRGWGSVTSPILVSHNDWSTVVRILVLAILYNCANVFIKVDSWIGTGSIHLEEKNLLLGEGWIASWISGYGATFVDHNDENFFGAPTLQLEIAIPPQSTLSLLFDSADQSVLG